MHIIVFIVYKRCRDILSVSKLSGRQKQLLRPIAALHFRVSPSAQCIIWFMSVVKLFLLCEKLEAKPSAILNQNVLNFFWFFLNSSFKFILLGVTMMIVDSNLISLLVLELSRYTNNYYEINLNCSGYIKSNIPWPIPIIRTERFRKLN